MLILDVLYKGNTEGFCTKADGKALESAGKLAVTGVTGLQITLNATF
jgi:hypothetical protein